MNQEYFFAAFVNSVLLQKYWRITEFNYFNKSRIIFKRDVQEMLSRILAHCFSDY